MAARLDGNALRIENRTTLPLHYVVVESDTFTRIDLAPCAAPAECPATVPAGGAVLVARGAITGYAPSAREVVIQAFHLVPQPGGTAYTYESVPLLRVPLR